MVCGNEKAGGTQRRIIDRVRFALMFRYGPPGRVPGVGPQPGRVVDRQARIVTDQRSAATLALIFVYKLRPGSGEVELRQRRLSAKRGPEDDEHR